MAIGTTNNPNGTSPRGAAIVRYNVDGTLDTSFGSGGIAKFFSPQNMDVTIKDGVIDSAGNILAIGSQTNAVVMLLRVTPTGALDPAFNSVGYLILSNMTAQTIRLQADGKIVVGGLNYSGKYPIGLVARVNTNGTLDATFGSNGQVTLSAFRDLRAIALQTVNAQQYILAGGNSASNNATVVRLTPSGSLDASFGTSGVATTLFCGGFPSKINSLSVDPMGNILVGGTTEVVSSGTQKFAIERLTNYGALDTSFGDLSTTSSGRTGQTRLDYFSAQNIVNSIQPLLDSGGNQIGFLVGGFVQQSTGPYTVNRYLVIAQYHADGSLDTSFGTNGGIALDFGSKDSSGISPGNDNTLIQSDGKVVIVGAVAFTTGPSGYNFALARIWP